MMTNKKGGEQVNRRIRKKKGLLKDLYYNHIKKELFQAMEEKAESLERQASVHNHEITIVCLQNTKSYYTINSSV